MPLPFELVAKLELDEEFRSAVLKNYATTGEPSLKDIFIAARLDHLWVKTTKWTRRELTLYLGVEDKRTSR